MVNISNDLSHSSPIPEKVLEAEALSSFENCNKDINSGVQTLLQKLTERAEAQGYKFIVTVTSIGASTQGPVKTYTGAFWNAEQDGTWVTHLESLDLLVSVTWIHL